ncbi:thiolase, C-terminal domain protein [Bordetella holmesii 70147]|nr:thiolase, C-terminal domain protein [Bordetella holmesii 70147]
MDKDEHPRETTLESLAKLKGVVREGGSVTAGNASGVNDGAVALLLADEKAAARHGLTPRARVVGMATAGVAPRIMGMGPAPATRKVLAQTGLTLAQMDVIELNEAFAAQGLAVLRDLGIADDDARVNPNGAPLRWAILWAPVVPAWRRPPSISCIVPGRAMPCAPCALAGSRNCADHRARLT